MLSKAPCVLLPYSEGNLYSEIRRLLPVLRDVQPITDCDLLLIRAHYYATLATFMILFRTLL